MKQLILLVTISLLITSCNSQTDLETMKYNQDITEYIDDSFSEDNNIITGQKAYISEDVQKFKYGSTKFNNYTHTDDLIKDSNSLSFFVDSYDKNKYLGFQLDIWEIEKSNELLNYLMQKYGKPLKKYEYKGKGDYLDKKYLWESVSTDEIVFVNIHNENRINSSTKQKYISSQSEFIIIKRGLILKPSEENNPENIKKLLEENPNAFNILEILKKYFY
ncbi:hypothetical protein [Flavobacterium hydatis]|uniref:Lipoprotein n=1 Tax=Flavobacterium hydatis TaxID=991 RepID=A0A086A928_FLAHY|nr:hypothetical protein [Flavobacterium hydatis]KFF13192.1 hypothetical protein IW20_18000 [Flavobacterium hydatis]OXA94190.1 hypothetical protein B0A62_11060 [Flavobacterium hydatis]